MLLFSLSLVPLAKNRLSKFARLARHLSGLKFPSRIMAHLPGNSVQ